MTGFSPIVTTDELGTYLGDKTIDATRAAMFIEDAQMLCQTVVNPLPPGADLVVRRMAGEAYTRVTSTRAAQLAAAQSPFGQMVASSRNGVWLSDYDISDLNRLAAAADDTGGTSSGGAFSINMLPASYAAALPIWDVNGDPPTVALS